MDFLKLLYTRDTRVEPTLDGISKLLDRLGNPEKNFDAIQIGGTNGKTSTTHFLSVLLQSQGLKVGRYTSPHLESFSERIAVDNENIEEKELIQTIKNIFDDIKAVEVSIGRELTGFEILTACAYSHFDEKKVDIAVVEVGMGGRWDATSVVFPKVCVITNVQLDHMNFLGDSTQKIAGEKIGIVKGAVPLVTTEEDKDILEIFSSHCGSVNSKIYRWPIDFNAESIDEDNSVKIRTLFSTYELPVVLRGGCQLKNISLAIVAAELYLGKNLNFQNATAYLKKLKLGGRLETVSKKPTIILDGAHNPAAVKELIMEIKKYRAGRKKAVIAILSDKDADGMLELFSTAFDEAIITQNDSERALSVRDLFGLARRHFKKVKQVPSLFEAIELAKKGADENDLICITGSLYTVGAAKRYFQNIM